MNFIARDFSKCSSLISLKMQCFEQYTFVSTRQLQRVCIHFTLDQVTSSLRTFGVRFEWLHVCEMTWIKLYKFLLKPDNVWQEEKSISKTIKIQHWTCIMIYVYSKEIGFSDDTHSLAKQVNVKWKLWTFKTITCNSCLKIMIPTYWLKLFVRIFFKEKI